MGYVFISYSTQNRTYAQKLAKKLQGEGIDVWIDNAKIRSGENWWQSIVKALSAASAVVVLMTPASRASQWVQREILLADQMKKRVFPVLLEGENWEIFVDIQYADMRKTKGLPSKVFFEELHSLLNIDSSTMLSNSNSLNPKVTDFNMQSDKITNIRSCLSNGAIIAAVIGAATTIIAALIVVILPTLISSNGGSASPQATTVVQTSTLNTNLTPPPTSLTAETSTFVPTTSRSSTSQPTETHQPIHIGVVRGRDIIAISVNATADFSNLVLDFSGNEQYRLGDIFPASSSTQANQVWCLRQRADSQPIDNCVSDNSYTTPNTGNSWRNASISFYLNENLIGTCMAQPTATGLYGCEMLTVNLP